MSFYRDQIINELVTRHGYNNLLAVPRLEKIVINMGVGKARENPKLLEGAMRDLSAIAGQQPVATVARKSIAGFKIRDGNKIGCKVTLRRDRMYEFLDRLISIVIPRIRDFRGLPRKFDGRGNYSMGIDEQIVFPEVDLDKIAAVQGMHITIVTTARNDEEGFSLLELFGMPFKKS
jgi:large subunit ribosomal protein L5